MIVSSSGVLSSRIFGRCGKAITAEQKKLDAKLSRETAQHKRKAKARWNELATAHADAKKIIREDAKLAQSQALRGVLKTFDSKWEALYARQAEERESFQKDEQSMLGKVRNIRRAIHWRGFLNAGQRKGALRDAFRVISGSRRSGFDRVHLAEERALLRDQGVQEKAQCGRFAPNAENGSPRRANAPSSIG